MSSQPPISNHITDACEANKQPYLIMTSDGTPQMSKVVVSDGPQLGLIQSACWSISLDGYSRLTVETIASPAELKVLLKDTEVRVRPAPGYNPFRYLWDWTTALIVRALNR